MSCFDDHWSGHNLLDLLEKALHCCRTGQCFGICNDAKVHLQYATCPIRVQRGSIEPLARPPPPPPQRGSIDGIPQTKKERGGGGSRGEGRRGPGATQGIGTGLEEEGDTDLGSFWEGGREEFGFGFGRAIRYWPTSWCDSRRAATIWRWGRRTPLPPPPPPHAVGCVQPYACAATHGALRGRCWCFRILGHVWILVRCGCPLARFPHLVWAILQHGCPHAQILHSLGSRSPPKVLGSPPSRPACGLLAVLARGPLCNVDTCTLGFLASSGSLCCMDAHEPGVLTLWVLGSPPVPAAALL